MQGRRNINLTCNNAVNLGPIEEEEEGASKTFYRRYL